MTTQVIMPALGMAQETGKVLRWLRAEGDPVTQGEPLLEIETDKVTVEIEAPASGILQEVTAAEGQEVPVGQTIARIVSTTPTVAASPLAARLAAEHGVDLLEVKPSGGRIAKSDVLAFLEKRKESGSTPGGGVRTLASPKARRLAAERGVDIAALQGTGPAGAVVAADVPAAGSPQPAQVAAVPASVGAVAVSTAWRIMAERTTRSWTGAPHFYLVREVDASRLVAWRERCRKRLKVEVTYTDLLVRLVAVGLRRHSRLNARWQEGKIVTGSEINVGLAVAVEDGLVVPVIHRADQQSVAEIAARRGELVGRAQAGKLRPEDLAGGTFTVSNLGMYGVDVFNAIINPPQAALLAVGRIADRVVAVEGRPTVRPMMTLSLSCDHRVVDGARGALFLEALANLIEEPLELLE